MVGRDASLEPAIFPMVLIAFRSDNKVSRFGKGTLCKSCLDGMTELEIAIHEKRWEGEDLQRLTRISSTVAPDVSLCEK